MTRLGAQQLTWSPAHTSCDQSVGGIRWLTELAHFSSGPEVQTSHGDCLLAHSFFSHPFFQSPEEPSIPPGPPTSGRRANHQTPKPQGLDRCSTQEAVDGLLRILTWLARGGQSFRIRFIGASLPPQQFQLPKVCKQWFQTLKRQTSTNLRSPSSLQHDSDNWDLTWEDSNQARDSFATPNLTHLRHHHPPVFLSCTTPNLSHSRHI